MARYAILTLSSRIQRAQMRKAPDMRFPQPLTVGALCVGALCAIPQALVAADNPLVSWATSAGGSGNDYGNGVAALADGGSIVAGSFTGTATFGGTSLASGGTDNIFVTKSRADGSVAWATGASGTGSDWGYGVAALPDGSSIITGSLSGATTFGATTLTSTGSDDIFVAKLRADGSWAWATAASGLGSDYAQGISALPDGSAIVTGVFTGSATFGATTLQSTGAADIFAAKITASGAWAWASSAGGLDFDNGNAISTLPDGSSIVTGRFRDSATFGGITITSIAGSNLGSDEVFVAKISADGVWMWATPAGGIAEDRGQGISALPDGSALVTGAYTGTANFGSTVLPNTGPTVLNAFVAKITASGAWAWATPAGGPGFDTGYALSALTDGSAIVTGYVQTSADFGSIPLTVPAGTGNVIFTAKIGATGTWEWVQAGEKTGYASQVGLGVAASPDGSAVVTGQFDSPVTFGSFALTDTGNPNVFTVRYVFAPPAPAAPVATAGDGSAAVSLTPLAGGAITSYQITSNPGARTCTVVAPQASCTVTGLTNGTSHTFTATATNQAGTSPPSMPSNVVTPTAAAVPSAKPSLTGKVRCAGRTCVTTGIVPATATRHPHHAAGNRATRTRVGEGALHHPPRCDAAHLHMHRAPREGTMDPHHHRVHRYDAHRGLRQARAGITPDPGYRLAALPRSPSRASTRKAPRPASSPVR